MFTHNSFLTGIPLSQHISRLFSKLHQYLLTFNVFLSIPPTNDEHELHTQRISTKLFICLFVLLMTILLLYTSLIKVTKIIDVQTPDLQHYSLLHSTYSQTLTCSCTKISINYQTFLRIQYTLHQVCTSIFVTNDWINYLANPIGTPYITKDFRVTASSTFQALRIFCDLINNTISDSLIQFYSNQYVSASVTPSQLFESQTESLINQFRSSMTKSFLLSLSMIHNTTQANALYSALATNYILNRPINKFAFFGKPQRYNNCSCGTSSTCVEQSSIYNFYSTVTLFNVPSFYTGCYVIEALLQSSLQCFYNQSCINEIRKYLSSTSSMIVKSLNSSLTKEYLENSTIKELLNKLMIEKWNSSVFYDKYYDECKPTQCTYTVERRNDIINIFTTLFGIAGGLITILKLVVPRLVKIIRKKKEPTTGKTIIEKGKIQVRNINNQ